MSKDVVGVSYDERGFWHCDLFKEAEHWDHTDWDNAQSEGFCTTHTGASEQDAINLASSVWPNAIIRVAREEEHDDH